MGIDRPTPPRPLPRKQRHAPEVDQPPLTDADVPSGALEAKAVGIDKSRGACSIADSPAAMATLARSVLAKAAVLPVTAVTALASAHIVVGAVGVPGYALFTLVITLPGLLPLGDLGAGAAVTEAVARHRRDDPELLRRTVGSAGRMLSCAAVVVMAVGVVPAVFGLWPRLLGGAAGRGTDAGMAVAGVLFACTLPLGLGRSLLLSLNRSHTASMLQAAAGVVGLALILSAAQLRLPAPAFVAAGFLGQCAWGAGCLFVAGRHLDMPLLRLVLTSLCATDPPVRIRHLAAPMAVISAATALAFATDRLVLSHAAGAAAVAVYSAGAQMFVPAVGLVSAAGLPLWALFARQRHLGSPPAGPRQLARLTWGFAWGGALLGVGLGLLGPSVGSWITHERAHVGSGLMSAFGALLFVQALTYPASMWLTDEAGLRFQATRTVVMAALNLALSIPLARMLGAAGPVLGSVTAYTAVVTMPTLRRAWSHA